MDILLNDIRLNGLESASPDRTAAGSHPPFSALLGGLPHNGAEPPAETVPAVTGEALPVDEKLFKISSLEDIPGPGEGLVTAAAVITDDPVEPSPELSRSKPTAAAIGVADAVRQLAAAIPASPAPMETTAPVVPLESGQALPPGGNRLPRDVLSQNLAAVAVAPQPAVNKPAETARDPGSVAPLLSAGPQAVKSVQPSVPAELPSTATVEASLRDRLGVSAQQAQPVPVLAADRPAVSTPAPTPLKTDVGADITSQPQQPAVSMRVTESSAKIDGLQSPSAQLTAAHVTLAAAQPAPAAVRDLTAAAEIESLPGRDLDPGLAPKTLSTRTPVIPAVVAEASTPQPVEEGAARENWLRATLAGSQAARIDLRPSDGAGPGTDPAGDLMTSLRDGPSPRSIELLQAQAMQTNATQPAPTAVAASAAPASPLTASPSVTGMLPPQLETMTLARDAAPADWGEGLGERVSWLINHKQNSASIRLDPPALGRLDVQIRIADDAATITIQAQQLQTRDLIDAATPRLREFLQEAGFQNVNVDVSHRQDQQLAQGQRQHADNPLSTDDQSQAETEANPVADEIITGFRGDGLVDTFA